MILLFVINSRYKKHVCQTFLNFRRLCSILIILIALNKFTIKINLVIFIIIFFMYTWLKFNIFNLCYSYLKMDGVIIRQWLTDLAYDSIKHYFAS